MTWSIVDFAKYILFCIGLAVLVACGDAQNVQITANLDELTIQAGTAEGKYWQMRTALPNDISDDDLMQWTEENAHHGGFGYFDNLYQYGLANLDNEIGFEALVLALEVSIDANPDYKKIRKIHEKLYKHYLNNPAYAYVLQNIKLGYGVGYKGDETDKLAWDANQGKRYKRGRKLLERVVGNATNPTVKNHARLYMADFLERSFNGLEIKDIAIIVKRSALAENLIQDMILETEQKPIEVFSSRKIKNLSLFRRAARASEDNEPMKPAESTTDTPSPQSAQKTPKKYLHTSVKKLRFRLQNLTIGKHLPPAVSVNLNEEPQDFEQYKGKVLLIDFWATWCGPCIAKFPHLRELKKTYADRPFEILGMSGDQKIDEVIEFVKDTDMPWDIWFSGVSEGIMIDWGIYELPTVFLVDHTGRLMAKNPSEQQLETMLGPLVIAAEAELGK